MKLRSMFILVLICLMPAMVNAAFIPYSDATLWSNAVGPVDATEDFTSFASDTEFRTSAVSLAGGMSIRAFNETVITLNLINAAGDYAFARTGAGVSVQVDFTTPVSAWGSTLFSYDNSSIRVYDASDALLGSISGQQPPDRIFRGFNLDSGESAAYLTFTASGSDVFRIEDMSVVNAIPIPAALPLFGSGLLGLVGIARRKKAA